MSMVVVMFEILVAADVSTENLQREAADRMDLPVHAKLSLQTGSCRGLACRGTGGTLVRLGVELMRCASTNALRIASARAAWRGPSRRVRPARRPRRPGDAAQPFTPS